MQTSPHDGPHADGQDVGGRESHESHEHRARRARERESDRHVRGWLKENWGWIAPIAYGLLFCAQVVGFRWVNPQDEIAALKLADVAVNRRIDSLAMIVPRGSTVDSLRRDMGLAKSFVIGLVKDRCLQISAERAVLLGLPCDSLGVRTRRSATDGGGP